MASNISAILAIGDLPWCNELRVYIAENSSKDNTREVISRLVDQDSRVIPVFLDDLDEQVPVREARIALCRDRLLDEIYRSESEGLYIPIDLDSEIASSLEAEAFRQACQLVASGECTGVFPSSSPHYYDIHALREPDWCPRSCWKEVQEAKPNSALWSLLVSIRYVYSRQKPHAILQAKGLIPIESAFGGVGIYSLTKASEANARYSSPDLEKEYLKLCEHVVFNSFFDRLFISTDWVVSSPPEHIEFCLLPGHHKAWRIARAGLGDIKRMPFGFARRVIRLILRNVSE